MTTKQLISIEPIRDEIKQKLIEKYNTTTFFNTNSIDLKLDIKDLIEEHIKEKNVEEPAVYMTTEAYIKMRTLVKKTDTEVGWYGFVNKMEGTNYYVIEDIVLYPQRVTGATVEQDEDKMFEFEMSLTNEQVNHKRFQGHSHVNMGVTPSGVDEQFYQDLLTQVRDYFIVLINNKSNSTYLRFYDVENNIVYNGLELKVLLEDGTDANLWYDIVKEQIQKPEIKTAVGWPTTYDKHKEKKRGRPTKEKEKVTPSYKQYELDDYSYNPYDDYDYFPHRPTLHEQEMDLKSKYERGIISQKEFDTAVEDLWSQFW